MAPEKILFPVLCLFILLLTCPGTIQTVEYDEPYCTINLLIDTIQEEKSIDSTTKENIIFALCAKTLHETLEEIKDYNCKKTITLITKLAESEKI